MAGTDQRWGRGEAGLLLHLERLTEKLIARAAELKLSPGGSMPATSMPATIDKPSRNGQAPVNRLPNPSTPVSDGPAPPEMNPGGSMKPATRQLPPAPLNAVSDGPAPVARNERGQFGPGNKCAAGNPFARRVAKLRSALLDAVSEGDVQAVAQTLVEQAKAGDVAAAKLLLAYTVGKPAEAPDPDRLDLDELALLKTWPNEGELFADLAKTPAPAALTFVRNMVPILAEGLTGKFLDALNRAGAQEHAEALLDGIGEKAPRQGPPNHV